MERVIGINYIAFFSLNDAKLCIISLRKKEVQRRGKACSKRDPWCRYRCPAPREINYIAFLLYWHSKHI